MKGRVELQIAAKATKHPITLRIVGLLSIMPTQGEQIESKAIEILLKEPQGVRYTALESAIIKAYPNINPNAVGGVIWNLDDKFPNIVYKVSRGLFRHVNFKEPPATEVTAETISPIAGTQNQLREEDFYASFADFLKRDLDEATTAISLGGKIFEDKWSTPDVIGITKSMPSDFMKGDPAIVSAEIKFGISTTELLTAFGQACVYRIFSHKVYIVIPKISDVGDREKIESLCYFYGMGLILFDRENKDQPNYEIKVRAMRNDPDIWYVNKYMKKIEAQLFP